MKKKIKISSDAFPSKNFSKTKNTPISETHSLLQDVQVDKTKIIFKKLVKDDIIEITKLHKEWFPIDYENDFYQSCIENTSRFYSLGAFYKLDDSEKEVILGSILVDFQTIEQKFLTHSSEEILQKISDEISFSDDASCTLTLNNYHCAYIMTIGVVDECRRIGLGSMLIYNVIQKSLQDETNICVYLDVVDYNATAINFYKKNGFEEVTTIRNYYKIKGEIYDSKVFVKILTKKEKEEYRKKNYSLIYRVFKNYIAFPTFIIFRIITFDYFFRYCRKKNKLE